MAGPTSTSTSTSTSSSSRGKWRRNLSTYAARIYFFLIILQVPLFRVPCRSGICTTPLQVTSCQLISSEIFPLPVVKGLLYPGAVLDGLITNMTVPSWDNLLNIYNLTGVKEASAATDLQRLEVLAGSYFSAAGAFIGILRPGRMSMFGSLLVIWGLVKEGILGKPVNADPTSTKAVFVYPTMLIALICAFLSVKYDVKKVMRSAPARPVAKPLKSSVKSKLK
ncbi:hypothetical protein ACH5RR_040135 [Cinchona calisaya]|uniref:Uncharacterized protein n=1 Tax=Cinchona calisaya TaxID=153742 RepID=A0ABD2XVB9_9GENT